MGLKRKQDWQIILDEEFRRRSAIPFKYGTHDCCVTFGEIIESMTGTSLFTEKFRPQSSKEEAYRYLAKFGGLKGFMDCVAEEFGIQEIPLKRAGPGDMVMTKDYAFGMVALNGTDVFFIGPEKGWSILKKKMAKYAWRI